MNNDDLEEKQDRNDMTTIENDSIASASEISDFASYVKSPEMGLDHEFSICIKHKKFKNRNSSHKKRGSYPKLPLQ